MIEGGDDTRQAVSFPSTQAKGSRSKEPPKFSPPGTRLPTPQEPRRAKAARHRGHTARPLRTAPWKPSP